mmetsp:Transcript_28486/g.47008  ORF Transcript_28486/g.47008 Transcript_28486/m.47008 type:complete len:86 (+) Transcript_28486:942-1199(+)
MAMDTVAPAFGGGGNVTPGKPGRPGAPMGGKAPGKLAGNGAVAGTGTRTSMGAPGSGGAIPGAGIGIVKAFGGSPATGCIVARVA